MRSFRTCAAATTNSDTTSSPAAGSERSSPNSHSQSEPGAGGVEPALSFRNATAPSGPTTDEAMTRSEEQLRVGTQTREAGRARLRKHVATEHQQVSVPVSHEEITLDREPITEANRGAAYDGPAISEEEHEVTLRS